MFPFVSFIYLSVFFLIENLFEWLNEILTVNTLMSRLIYIRVFVIQAMITGPFGIFTCILSLIELSISRTFLCFRPRTSDG